MTIYIVTYWDKGKEPVVTVFDNRDAAESCYRAFRDSYDGCCIDESTLYHSFLVKDDGKEGGKDGLTTDQRQI